MLLSHRTPIVVCLLLLVALLVPTSSPTHAQAATPSLAVASMVTSPFGMVTVAGDGFTPGGLVRLIVHDLAGVGPTLDTWTVAANGSIELDLPYLAATTYGPHGSQDPAQGYTEGTLDTFTVGVVFGPNGSQDPAQGFLPAALQWPGGCPDLLVHALDVRAETWSNSLDVQIADC